MECKKFLALMDKHEVQSILGNCRTDKAALMHNGLRLRPRYPLPFTPTRPSWLNQVARRFVEIMRWRIRRGTLRSTQPLDAAVREYLQVYNEDPQPFV